VVLSIILKGKGNTVTPSDMVVRSFDIAELIFWIILLVPSITGLVLLGAFASLIVYWSSKV